MDTSYSISLTSTLPSCNAWRISKPIVIVLLMIIFSSCHKEVEPSRILRFEEIALIHGVALDQATGFTGSKELNSLYIVNRDVNSWPQYTERVIKYDLSSGEQVISNIVQVDYITKNAHLLNGKLIVIGGTRVNIYPQNLGSPPVSIEHGLSLSRFGSAIYNDELYIWGGDLNYDTSTHIRRWDFENGKFETVGFLPKPRMWAHGEIIDNKLYVFGGQKDFVGTPSSDIIYVYNFQSKKTETYFLPEPMMRTFTAVHENRIYVAGHILNDDGEVRTTLGFFDTKDNTSSTFSASEANDQILQMTIIENRVYILLGPIDAKIGVSLQVADL